MRNTSFAALAALIALLAAPLSATAQNGDFYTVAKSEIAGPAGSIIRADAFKAPPGASAAYRVIYRSTGAGGQPIAVSGIVVIPQTPAPPEGRPIVSWAHATSGIVQGCARSEFPDIYEHMYGLQDMLAAGAVVAATDYPGLGVSGAHPYLDRHAGYAMIDMARAARNLPQAQAGDMFIPAGYSQGGHAALFAGTYAPSYAPELKLKGIAASAPPTNLGELIRESGEDPLGRVFVTYAIAAWSKFYGLPYDGVVEKRVSMPFAHIARKCNLELDEGLGILFIEQNFEREGFLATDVTATEPWANLVARNSPGPTPPGVPVFIAQGTGDMLVRAPVTQAYAARLCARGTDVTLLSVPAAHAQTAPRAAPAMSEWIAARFNGKRAPNDCRSLRGSAENVAPARRRAS
jgi:alpha-beta hydrolase superfamily lysophospholipase